MIFDKDTILYPKVSLSTTSFDYPTYDFRVVADTLGPLYL